MCIRVGAGPGEMYKVKRLISKHNILCCSYEGACVSSL